MNILLIFVVIVQTWIRVQSREPFSKTNIFVLSSNSQNELEVGNKNVDVLTKYLLLTSTYSSKASDGNENNANSLRYSTTANKECLHFDQLADSIDDVLKVCAVIGNSTWFGGPELQYQYWPLNRLNLTDVPYITTGQLDGQAVMESYFFNSDGYYIHVDESVPLFLDINGPTPGNICFTSKVKAPYRRLENRLKFRVCEYENPRVAHENAIKDIFGKPTSIPDTYLVRNPIWSTWAKYKEDVNTSAVLDYANQIIKSGFPLGQLEIDDNWETCWGEAEFDKIKFENIQELVSNLKSKGFKVSLWTHPFINVECASFKIAESLGYFVNSTEHKVVTTWWHKEAGQIDFTNPAAAKWWSARLRKLLNDTGIDTLKFDAGESTWLPQIPVFYDTDLTYQPDNLVNAYIDTISKFGNGIEYRTARRVQKHGRFVRMIDKLSLWSWKFGLPTLVTTLLQFNMIGYPFVLPDMIGGNAYDGDMPSAEMYVRWMQANTFMPAIQFSITPWDFGKETAEICKKYMDLHQKYSDLIIQLMENTVSTGAPINPPIWWIDPTDTTAHSIDDEFLLGEDILVAPVLVEKAVQRDIYLPAGKWRDESRPNTPLIDGRTWLRNYPASLDTLPWFTRVNDSSSSVGSKHQIGYTVLVTCIGIMFIVKTVMTNF